MRSTKDRSAYNRAYYHKRKRQILALKSVPCTDCGVQYATWIMQFDHRPGTVKRFNVTQGWSFKPELVLQEAAKCDVVCANCHADRTYRRWQEKLK